VYNTVVEQLGLRADRKFIIVEMIFFSRWFNEVSDAERAAVRTFVANGQVRDLRHLGRAPWQMACWPFCRPFAVGGALCRPFAAPARPRPRGPASDAGLETAQIEFVLGGWCMSDDADPTYSASTNQMAEGHKWIFNTFGVTPRYGWHIGTPHTADPAGGQEEPSFRARSAESPRLSMQDYPLVASLRLP